MRTKIDSGSFSRPYLKTNAKMASQSSSDLETISKKQTLIDMYPNVVLTQGQKSVCHFVNGST